MVLVDVVASGVLSSSFLPMYLTLRKKGLVTARQLEAEAPGVEGLLPELFDEAHGPCFQLSVQSKEIPRKKVCCETGCAGHARGWSSC